MKEDFSNRFSFKELCSYEAYSNNKDYHMHNFLELYLLLDGDVNLYIHQSCYHVISSSVAIINSFEPHKFVNNRDTKFTRIYFHIPNSLVSRYSSDKVDLAGCFMNRSLGKNNVLLLTQPQTSYIKDIHDRLTNISRSKTYGKELLFDTYAIQLLIYTNNVFRDQTFTAARQYSPDIQYIIEYIDTHLNESITLDILAGKLSRNKYYISHKFKDETETSISHYLIMSRISRAKILLTNGMNVTEACYNSGFNDYSNFITTFRKITGYTPKRYQMMQNKG